MYTKLIERTEFPGFPLNPLGSFFFNNSGNYDAKHVNLFAMKSFGESNHETRMIMFDKNNNAWNKKFQNHQKLVFPAMFLLGFGCTFMVK